MEIAGWLRELGLGRYEEAFRDNDIDAKVLPHLTAEDLKDIGITSVGHRRRLLAAIEALQPETAAPEPELSAAAPSAVVPSREAERRQLTVMFCDLVGSTALSTELDPEDMRSVIQSYQDACAGVIARFEGHVAKFMGDGVLAYFGWPRAHEDDAERAVRAGVAIADAVAGLAVDGRPLAARIGIATGLVVVGDLIGEGAAQEEAVVGDTPNLAARLQGLAEPGQVVIAPSTEHLLGALFELEDMGSHNLKGLPGPVQPFAVAGEGRAESRFAARRGGHLTPLVGRDEELGLLLSRWRRVIEGEGQVALLSGEPGIGKSRITEALRERLVAEAHIELRYFCSPFHTNSALHPVLEQLVRAAGFEHEDGDEAKLDKLETVLVGGSSSVAELAALLAPLLSLATGDRYPPRDLSPQRQKQRTLQLLTEQLAGLAADRPVLMILEDAHWLDPTTQELFDLMIERLVGLPVLLLATFRPEFSAPWLGHAHVTQLSLNRLSQRQGSAMVGGLLGNKALPDEVLERIVGHTDGVPLFVEELTKTVLESGLLRDAGDRYELAGPLIELTIPSTLQDSLMARLDRLAPVKEVAQIGAAIGRQFPHDLMAAVTPLDEERLRAALDQLVDSELVFRRGTPPDAIYTFKHALVQDVAYRSLLKSTRAALHDRIAKALERHFPQVVEVQPELLAHHQTAAGMVTRALGSWLRAGERAQARSAHLEAVAHLRRGLALIGELSETPERARKEVDFHAALGISLLATKGFAAPEVGESYAKAEALSEQTGITTRLYAILQGLWFHRTVRGELQRALELAQRCHRIACDDGDPGHLLAAHHALSQVSFYLGSFEDSRTSLDEALRHADQADRATLAMVVGADLLVFVRTFGAHTLWHLGLVDRAEQVGEEALKLARAEQDPFSLTIALAYGAMLRQFARDRPGTQALAAEAIGICTEHHFAYYLAWATILHGWAEVVSGRHVEGIAEMERALAAMEDQGARLRHTYYLSLLADAHGRAGNPERGLAIIDDAIAVGQRMSEHWRDADLHRLRGELLLGLGRAADAEASWQHALAIARQQGARSLELRAALDLARWWVRQGRQAEARDLLAPVHASLTEGFHTADLIGAKALLDELA